MTLTYGFYNSVNGDRLYDAEQMSSLFDGLLTDGVLSNIGDYLIVTPGTGLAVMVGTGRAWFNHTWSYNDAPVSLALAQADVVNPRYDAVVLEINTATAYRENKVKIVTGTPGASPAYPTLTNSGTLHQYALAYVLVPVNSSTVIQGNITNMIGTTACPFAAGPLTTVTMDVLLAQFENQFLNWFANLQNQLTTNQAANLQNFIDLLWASNAVHIRTIIGAVQSNEFDFHGNFYGTYKKLRIVGALKYAYTGSMENTGSIVFNEDDNNGHYTGVNPVDGSWFTPNDVGGIGWIVNSQSSNEGFITPIDIELPDYAVDGFYKWYITKTLIGVGDGNPSAGIDERIGLFRRTDPITRVKIPGLFALGSHLSLYGIPI
jgi:hypothetical protein